MMVTASNKPFFHTLLACIISSFRRLLFQIQAWIHRSTGPVISLDTGRRVRLGRQIAEGGFSIVFEATDADFHNNNNNKNAVSGQQRYALKRISCPDPEILRACRNEAGIHRSVKHPNLMPLLGMSIQKHDSLCYMLFPYYSHSLRQEVNRRTFERGSSSSNSSSGGGGLEEPPWPNELIVLQIFHRVLQGVQALHEQARHSHRDIKLENILFQEHHHNRHHHHHHHHNNNKLLLHPVLMDFGSAGPLTQSLTNRRDVLMVAEEASKHTTVSYRPPELFEGGVRTGDAVLDYTKVDVWSLGCTLFAMLYGASPLESEFYNNNNHHHHHRGHHNHHHPHSTAVAASAGCYYDCLKVTECTQLSVLKPVPRPPEHSPAAKWYSAEIHDLIEFMLQQDRQKRPTLAAVIERVEEMIVKQGGRVVDEKTNASLLSLSRTGSRDDDEFFEDVDIQGDGIALMTVDRMGV